MQDLQEWIFEDLSSPVLENNNLPLCPFAKKAWVDDKVNVNIVAEYNDFWKTVYDEIKNFDDTYQVVICAYDGEEESYENIERSCFSLNGWFAANNMDIWLLAFQEDITMVFVQRLSDLDDASQKLKKLGYYKNYNSEDFERLVISRRRHRHGK